MRMAEPVGMHSTQGEPVTLARVDAKGKVDGLLFEITVEQRYRNATESNIEAVYTFPLPHDAVLLDLEVEINGRSLKGVVVEKRKAERSYEQAIGEGHTAIMLERAGDGLLTANFGNLMAGEEAVIRYSVAQSLRLDHDVVRVTVPTVIAPRYGDPAAGGLQLHQAPTHDLAVRYPFSLAIELTGALARGKVASPSHAIALEQCGDQLVATLEATSSLDRDFVLTIADVEQRSLAIVEESADECVALASFRIDRLAKHEPLPLRLKILLDCSGSMNGDSIAAARVALRRVLASLDARDCFSLSRFGSRIEHKTTGLVTADERTVHIARAVAGIQADLGGTEMQQALETVFAIDAEGEPADVLLVTDGEIWAADSLIARARTENQRVFVVGVGSAPAHTVLRRLAEATGGACAFVTPNEDPEDTIVRMVERLRALRLRRVDVDWPTTPDWCTTPPTGIFAGETVHVFAGFRTAPKGDARLTARAHDGDVVPLASVTLPSASPEKTLARIAAAARLATLDDDTARLDLALRHSLLTEQTNVLIVHERAQAERALELPELAHVPQMLAAGWGGMGSVQASVKFSLDVSEVGMRYDVAQAPAVVRCGRHRVGERVGRDSVEALLRALDRHIESHGPAGLPETFDDLEQLGLVSASLDGLRALVTSGYDERTIVEAFLAELATHAKRFGAGRKFLRAMHRHGVLVTRSSELEAAVVTILARLRVHETIGEKLLEVLREAAD